MLYANPAALSLLGFENADEIAGHSLFALVAESYLGLLNFHADAAKPMISGRGFESLFRTRQGELLTVECRLSKTLLDGSEAGLMLLRRTSDTKNLPVQRNDTQRADSLSRFATTLGLEWQSRMTQAHRLLKRLSRSLSTAEAKLAYAELDESLTEAQARARVLSFPPSASW